MSYYVQIKPTCFTASFVCLCLSLCFCVCVCYFSFSALFFSPFCTYLSKAIRHYTALCAIPIFKVQFHACPILDKRCAQFKRKAIVVAMVLPRMLWIFNGGRKEYEALCVYYCTLVNKNEELIFC